MGWELDGLAKMEMRAKDIWVLLKDSDIWSVYYPTTPGYSRALETWAIWKEKTGAKAIRNDGRPQ